MHNVGGLLRCSLVQVRIDSFVVKNSFKTSDGPTRYTLGERDKLLFFSRQINFVFGELRRQSFAQGVENSMRGIGSEGAETDCGINENARLTSAKTLAQKMTVFLIKLRRRN